ncbi:uncharacterized protein LOC125233582 isoform X2 [Leguminivora glycinivorella]|uniref:uncharacterized protein LOC125233582 isoform X2 n=1 Tax=Leguminivora glycinivorella TaxID=1035111 RepID=UPI00200E63F6|nr:uncharacterized protein LOC125233582 isoform X2 [Leguminivora glycinivorella]
MAHFDCWKVLVKEFPWLYDTTNPDFFNEELKARCFEQLLEKCKNEGDRIDMTTLKQRLQNDLLLELTTSFPCLWNPQDSNYTNNAVRSLCLEQLLQLYNNQSYIRITMADLQHRIKGFDLALLLQSADWNDKLISCAKTYPCLWNIQDLYYNEERAKARSWNQLFSEIQKLGVPLNIEQLKKRIHYLKFRLLKLVNMVGPQSKPIASPLFLELAQEFPCLWDCQNIDFQNKCVRSISYKRLLEKYNRKLSVGTVTIENIKESLFNMIKHIVYVKFRCKNLGELQDEKLIKLVQIFPCLWASHPKYKIKRDRDRYLQEVLDKYNSESENPLTMDQLMKKLQEFSFVQLTDMIPASPTSTRRKSRLRELLEQFPCLWNREDLAYGNASVRKLSYQKLLDKYNEESPEPITTDALKKHIFNLKKRDVKYHKVHKICPSPQKTGKGLRGNRFMELLKEFPCLWNRLDLAYGNESVKRLSYLKLLQKYNEESPVPITMDALRKQLSNMRRRLKYAGEDGLPLIPLHLRGKAYRLRKLFEEFPCLWDSSNMAYDNATVRKQSYKKLLEKYNEESSVPINMAELKRLLRNMKKSMEYRKVRAKRKADEAVTGQTSSSPTLQHDVTPENSSDVEPLAGTYAANLVVLQGIPTVFSWCCFCRQVRDDCHELTHDKPYASTDRITLKVNDISVDVDLTKGTPRTVCQSCDAKLQEMYEFVKLVKEAQEKFTNVSNFDDLSGSPVNLNEIPSYMSTSDGEDVLYDPLSISETEFTNTKVSASKRKNNKEAAVPRKKFSVSIDFSSMSLSSFDDDSYGSNDIGSNCNQTFTSVDSSKASTREINKEVNITNSRHIAEIDTFNTANAQVTNNQQNTNTSFSDTLNIANVDIPVSVINKESGREVISTFRFSGCTLQIASEDVETLIVKEEYNELPNNIVDEDVHRHTITEMQLAESQNQPTIEITNTVTNKDSPKENTDEINVSSKVVSENAESVVIKEECIILSDDEDNNDIESTTNIKLEPTENTSVLYNLLGTSHLLDTNP